MTITIHIPDQLEGKLRARLDKDDTPLDEFVSQAIAEKLAREPAPKPEKPTAYELGKDLFGKSTSGREDLSENAERILREQLSAKHQR